jgi:beta-N-acetylhexosaminidase
MIYKKKIPLFPILIFLIVVIPVFSQDKSELKNKIQKIANDIVLKMSDEEKAGQVIHVSIPGKELDEIAISEIKRIKPGGIILFGNNLGKSRDISDLTESLQEQARKQKLLPFFISTDQEGGRVVRVKKGVTEFPGAMALGQTGNEKYAYDVGFITSYQLNRLGINLLLAPSLDINNNPDNPVINTRSFGSDLDTVNKIATSYEKGARDGGALPVIKHFPGHGDTNVDSHLGLPIIDKDLEQILNFELIPFQKAIENGARAVMSAHIVYPKIDPNFPATLSKDILSGILRERLKFDGIIMTDAMEMDAISKNYKKEKRGNLAILSGADIVLLTSWGKTTSEYYDMILDGIKKKEFVVDDKDYLTEALVRQISAKIEFGLFQNTNSPIEIVEPDVVQALLTRENKIKDKITEYKKINIKEYNLKISSDSIKSLNIPFTPLTPESSATYQFFLTKKYLIEEAKTNRFTVLSEKKFFKALKKGGKFRFVLDSNSQADLDKISKYMKQSPESEFILLHTGSPFLRFPESPNVSTILSFSITKSSQISMFRRIFQSSPEEKVQPCNLILKTKK